MGRRPAGVGAPVVADQRQLHKRWQRKRGQIRSHHAVAENVAGCVDDGAPVQLCPHESQLHVQFCRCLSCQVHLGHKLYSPAAARFRPAGAFSSRCRATTCQTRYNALQKLDSAHLLLPGLLQQVSCHRLHVGAQLAQPVVLLALRKALMRAWLDGPTVVGGACPLRYNSYGKAVLPAQVNASGDAPPQQVWVSSHAVGQPAMMCRAHCGLKPTATNQPWERSSHCSLACRSPPPQTRPCDRT